MMSQIRPKVIYLIVSGAVATHFLPDLIRQLPRFKLPIYTVMTDSAHHLISPWRLVEQPGHRLVESYFDPILTGEREPGLTVVAPATFNTINKISQGIADTLPHALAAEAIGAGWPMIVVPAVNSNLAGHPRFKQSLDTLRTWDITICGPQQAGQLTQMASVETVIADVASILAGTRDA